MDKFKQVVININSDQFTLSQLVSILILIVSKIDIDTISGMARSKGKTPSGIKISSNFKKIMIGCQKMAIFGLKKDSLPF